MGGLSYQNTSLAVATGKGEDSVGEDTNNRKNLMAAGVARSAIVLLAAVAYHFLQFQSQDIAAFPQAVSLLRNDIGAQTPFDSIRFHSIRFGSDYDYDDDDDNDLIRFQPQQPQQVY